jgi:hypothetical protein
VIALDMRRRRCGRPLGVFSHVVIPLIGALIDFAPLLDLQGRVKVIGLCWLTLGLISLLVLTRGFRRPPPEIDPLVAEAEPFPARPT